MNFHQSAILRFARAEWRDQISLVRSLKAIIASKHISSQLSQRMPLKWDLRSSREYLSALKLFLSALLLLFALQIAFKLWNNIIKRRKSRNISEANSSLYSNLHFYPPNLPPPQTIVRFNEKYKFQSFLSICWWNESYSSLAVNNWLIYRRHSCCWWKAFVYELFSSAASVVHESVHSKPPTYRVYYHS